MRVHKENKGIFVVALIVCAVICRILGNNGIYSSFFGLIRSMLYIGLYMSWGISVSRRVVQKPVRRCLITVSGMMVFWFVVRTIKYFFTENPMADRLLWYSYYIPMLFIPLMALFVAVLLGKPENASLPVWARLLFFPTVACIFLVLTNDWHQLVFSFPAGEIWTDKEYSYELGYFMVLGWEILCALAAFILMVLKSRQSKRKKYLPALLISVSVVYALIYVSGVEWMQMIGGDIAAVQCLMYTAMLESCIMCGLIQTNTGYEKLFEIGTIGAQIIDNRYHTQYISANAVEIPEDLMRAAENGYISMDKNTLLKSSPVSGGHVLWQEDIADIIAILEKLEENRKTIEENNCLEQENYNTRVKINTLREKTRLYDRLQKQTASQIDLLDRLLNQYETETNPILTRNLLAKIGVIGAYIKRRGNLLFIEEKTEVTETTELTACLEESFINLRYMGADCALHIPEGHRIPVKEAARVYDFFEAVMEAALDDIRFVWLKGRVLENSIVISMEIESDVDLSPFLSVVDSGICEDGVWRFTLQIGKVGEQA